MISNTCELELARHARGTLPVNFSWSSDNAVSGSMTAMLANGELFTVDATFPAA